MLGSCKRTGPVRLDRQRMLLTGHRKAGVGRPGWPEQLRSQLLYSVSELLLRDGFARVCLGAPPKALGLRHKLEEILPRDSLLLEESGDDGVEFVTVVAQELTSPALGFCEQPRHLLVDELLSAFGVGTLPSELRTVEVRGIVDP